MIVTIDTPIGVYWINHVTNLITADASLRHLTESHERVEIPVRIRNRVQYQQHQPVIAAAAFKLLVTSTYHKVQAMATVSALLHEFAKGELKIEVKLIHHLAQREPRPVANINRKQPTDPLQVLQELAQKLREEIEQADADIEKLKANFEAEVELMKVELEAQVERRRQVTTAKNRDLQKTEDILNNRSIVNVVTPPMPVLPVPDLSMPPPPLPLELQLTRPETPVHVDPGHRTLMDCLLIVMNRLMRSHGCVQRKEMRHVLGRNRKAMYVFYFLAQAGIVQLNCTPTGVFKSASLTNLAASKLTPDNYRAFAEEMGAISGNFTLGYSMDTQDTIKVKAEAHARPLMPRLQALFA